MKRALCGLSVAVLLGPMLLLSAVAKELSACGTEHKQRATCSESIGKPANASSEASQTDTTVAEFIAHFAQLKGKRVKVKGFLLIVGRSLFFQQARDDKTALSVDTTKVPHDQRRAVVYACGTGCDATVTGRADNVMLSLDVWPESVPGIVAESLVLR